MANEEQFGSQVYTNRIEQYLMVALCQLSDAQDLADDAEFTERIDVAKAAITEELENLNRAKPRKAYSA